MNKTELYGELVKMVPVKYDENKTFRVVIREQLGMFRKHLEKLDDKEQPNRWDIY